MSIYDPKSMKAEEFISVCQDRSNNFFCHIIDGRVFPKTVFKYYPNISLLRHN